MKRIERCAATNVEPGHRRPRPHDPASLLGAYGHGDCGVYLKVMAGGIVSVEDEIRLA